MIYVNDKLNMIYVNKQSFNDFNHNRAVVVEWHTNRPVGWLTNTILLITQVVHRLAKYQGHSCVMRKWSCICTTCMDNFVPCKTYFLFYFLLLFHTLPLPLYRPCLLSRKNSMEFQLFRKTFLILLSSVTEPGVNILQNHIKLFPVGIS